MEALFGLFFLSFVVGAIMITDIKTTLNKDNILIAELLLIPLPTMMFMGYLSFLVSDDVISSTSAWVMFIFIPTTLGYFIHKYNKKQFRRIDNEHNRIMLNRIECDRRIEENRRMKKEQYMKALQSGNKSNALQLGREYYSSLGLYDEQRIQNDLLCFLKLK